MSIKGVIRTGKEKPIGILVLSAIFTLFGLVCIVSSILFIALALEVISPVEGVISASGESGEIIGIGYFGILGAVLLYVAKGMWNLEKSARDGALFLMVLTLVTPTLELIGKYAGFTIEIGILPRFSDQLLISRAIPLLIIFILYFETYKGTFRAK